MPFKGYKLIKEETLRDIADAIREKTGKTGLLDPADFATLIRGIGSAPSEASNAIEEDA